MEFPNLLSEDHPGKNVKDSPSHSVGQIKRDHESVDDFEHLEISPSNEKVAGILPEPGLIDNSRKLNTINSHTNNTLTKLSEDTSNFDPFSQAVDSTNDFHSGMAGQSSSFPSARGLNDPLKTSLETNKLSSFGDKSKLSSNVGVDVSKFLDAEGNNFGIPASKDVSGDILKPSSIDEFDMFTADSGNSVKKTDHFIKDELSGQHFDSKEHSPFPEPSKKQVEQDPFDIEPLKSEQDPFIPDTKKTPEKKLDVLEPITKPEVVKEPEPVLIPKQEPISIPEPDNVCVLKPKPPLTPEIVSIPKPESEFESFEPTLPEVSKPAAPESTEPASEIQFTTDSTKKDKVKPVRTPDSLPIQKSESVPKKKIVDETADIIDPNEVLRRIGLDSWFKPETLHPKVEALVYWRDPKQSGAVFGSILVVLLSLTYYSLISVVAYLSLIVLTGTISFRIYKNVLQAVQKTSDGHPFKDILELELSLPQEKVREVTDTAVAHANAAVVELRRLFLVEDLIDSIKFAVLLWCLTHVGAWFNGMTLVIIAFIALFTLPKVYENNKTQIDANLAVVQSKLSEITSKVKAALPIGKKEAEKDKEQ